MKLYFTSLLLLFFYAYSAAQKKIITKEPLIPCNGNADALPGKYTDHTNPKYPSSLKGSTSDKAAMNKQLIAIEKIEEASRTNFQLTGCVARVSFNGGVKNAFGDYGFHTYGYQLGIYQNVCHVTEKVVKTVGEYRTVLRVDVNTGFGSGNFYGYEGDFYVTDKKVRYNIAIEAKEGANYNKDRFNNRTKITRYLDEDMVLAGRSGNSKDKHSDFQQLINGEGYVENWMQGRPEDAARPDGYQWIDRHYIITRPGIPLLIPVTRKAYLEALLEFYEIEKANFRVAMGYITQNEPAKASTCEADKAAFAKIYEYKKAKVRQLLTSSPPEWLQKSAVVLKGLRPDDNSKASNGLLDFENFYDGDPKAYTLYEYNPAYFKTSASQPLKPAFMEVQIRYELNKDKGFSKRYFDNFLQQFNLQGLRNMLN